jgi:hypothetical protein
MRVLKSLLKVILQGELEDARIVGIQNTSEARGTDVGYGYLEIGMIKHIEKLRERSEHLPYFHFDPDKINNRLQAWPF